MKSHCGNTISACLLWIWGVCAGPVQPPESPRSSPLYSWSGLDSDWLDLAWTSSVRRPVGQVWLGATSSLFQTQRRPKVLTTWANIDWWTTAKQSERDRLSDSIIFIILQPESKWKQKTHIVTEQLGVVTGRKSVHPQPRDLRFCV